MDPVKNLYIQSGILVDKPQLKSPTEANLCLLQTLTFGERVVEQRILCKVVGKNAPAAFDLEPGQHVYVEGKKVELNKDLFYIRTYKAEVWV